jgi:hypothetical protein
LDLPLVISVELHISAEMYVAHFDLYDTTRNRVRLGLMLLHQDLLLKEYLFDVPPTSPPMSAPLFDFERIGAAEGSDVELGVTVTKAVVVEGIKPLEVDEVVIDDTVD